MFTAHSVPARRSRRSTPLYLERLEDRLAPAIINPFKADMEVLANGPASFLPLIAYSVTITLANHGPNPADQVVLTDSVPPLVTVFGVTPAASNPDTFTVSDGGPGVIIFTAKAPILPSTNVDIFVAAITPSAGLPVGTVITDTATVTSSTPDPNPDNNSAAVATTLQSADMSVAITGPASIPAGGFVAASATITLTNNGPNPAAGVVLHDSISGITGYASDIGPVASNPDSFSLNVLYSTLTANGPIAPGNVDEFVVTFIAPAGVANGTVMTNSAAVSSTSNDPDSANNSAAVNTVVVQPTDVAVTETGPSKITAGAPVTYALSLTNKGSVTAFNVVLTDALPAGETLLSESQTSGIDAFAKTNSGNTAGFTAATMPAGDTDTFQVVARVASSFANGAALVNTADDTADNPNPSPGDATVSVTSSAVTVADVSIAASGPATIAAGSNASYTITLTDNGPSNAINVQLSDALPAGLTLTSAKQLSGPDAFTNASTGNTVSFTALTVADEDTDVFLIAAAAAGNLTAGSTVKDTATVTATTSDPNSANNSASINTTITPPPTDIAVTAAGPATIAAGTAVTYTLSLTNKGSAAGVNVVLTDALSVGETLVSASQTSGSDTFTKTSSGNTPGFTAATVAAGGTDSFQVVARAASSLASGTVLLDTASDTAENPNPDPADAISKVTTTAVAVADLGVVASGPATISAGGAATYTISLTNKGPSDASNVRLSDVLPSGLTLTSARQISGADAFTNASSGNTASLTAATVADGNTDVFLIGAAIAGNGPPGSTVADTATVTAGTSDGNLSNNTSTVTSPVAASRGSIVVAGSGAAQVVFVIAADGKLYQHVNATGWTAIGASGSVLAISAVAQANGSVVLFAEGPDHTLSVFIVGVGWQGTIGGKGTIAAISAGLDRTGQADVFVIDTAGNLDEWSTSSGWRGAGVSPAGGPAQLSAVDNDTVYAVTTNQSIWGNSAAWGWFPLTGPGFARSISATTDGRGNDTVYAVTVNGALFEHVNATGWAQLGGAGSIQTISAGRDASNQANVFVLTTGGQLAENDALAGWSVFHPPVSATAQFTAAVADDVLAVLADGSIDVHDDTFGFFPVTGPGFAEI